jgi:hypothetical protein
MASLTLSGGTANGVAYLNGSKVLTTGSALTFDGTTLLNNQGSSGTATAGNALFGLQGTSNSVISFNVPDANAAGLFFGYGGNPYWAGIEKDGSTGLKLVSGGSTLFTIAGSEQMRLTSTGLGIGTSSPAQKLDVVGTGKFTAQQSLILNGATGTFSTWQYNGTAVGDIGTGNQVISSGSTGDFALTSRSGNLVFGTGTVERMRLDSSGNVGIGTSSPGAKLDVRVSGATTTLDGLNVSNGTAAGIFKVTGATYSYRGVGSNVLWMGGDSTSMYVGTSTAQPVLFGTAAYEQMRLDTSGNLGLGVQPSAWNSDYKTQQIGGTSSFYGRVNSNQTGVGQNWYRTGGGGYVYIKDGTAENYEMDSGAHRWYTAASGTAGNAITFTQAMTLDASGNLGVGTTSPAYKLDVRGSLYVQRDTNPTNALAVQLTNQTTSSNNGCRLSFDAYNIGSSALGVPTDSASLAFYTGGVTTERARIDSSGNLLVGTTGQTLGTARLCVSSSGLTTVSTTSTSAESPYASFNTATSGNNQFMWFYTGDSGQTFRGSIEYNRGAGLVAYNVTSDYRAKDIIGPVNDSGALIDSTPVYMGKMKGATQERPMFIAHEVPAYAHTGEKDAVDADGNPVYQQMDASALIPVMWAEIQSLRKRLAAAGI